MGMHTPDDLDRMLTRLKLTAMRDQLDSLLDEAVRGEMTLRDALAFLCEREIARKDQRRIDMSFRHAGFSSPTELLAHTSPLGWAHIHLTGEYRWKNR